MGHDSRDILRLRISQLVRFVCFGIIFFKSDDVLHKREAVWWDEQNEFPTIGLGIVPDQAVHNRAHGSTLRVGLAGLSWLPVLGSNSPRCLPLGSYFHQRASGA